LCYRPYISSSTTTRKGHEQTSGGSAGVAGTSRAIGRGVAESHDMSRYQFGTWERGNVRDVLTYRRTQSLLWEGVMYLKDHSPYLDSSFLCSESQNTIGVNLLSNHSTSCYYIVDFLFTYTPSPLASLPYASSSSLFAYASAKTRIQRCLCNCRWDLAISYRWKPHDI
jgi:hypothetical protein